MGSERILSVVVRDVFSDICEKIYDSINIVELFYKVDRRETMTQLTKLLLLKSSLVVSDDLVTLVKSSVEFARGQVQALVLVDITG